MKKEKVWFRLVTRRALLMVPACALINFLADITLTAYDAGFLRNIFGGESAVTYVTVLITFVYITQVFLAFFYPFCLWVIRTVTPCFARACRIEWAEAVSRFVMVLLYAVMMGNIIVEELIPEQNQITVQAAYSWVSLTAGILNFLVTILLLQGLRNLLPGTENAAFRCTVRIFQWVWGFLTLFWCICLAGVFLAWAGLTPSWLLPEFFLSNPLLSVLLEAPGLTAFVLLLIGCRRIVRTMEAADAADDTVTAETGTVIGKASLSS